MPRAAAVRGPAALLLALTLAAFAAVAEGQVTVPTGFVNEPIATGLNQPTAFAFLPDGRVLVTEQKTGRVRLIVNGAIAPTACLTLNNLSLGGQEQGLLGIAVDPAWPTRPFVYVYFDRNDGRICLARYTATGDVSVPTGTNLTLGSARILIDDIPDNTVFHQAGCLRFGPDGMLYVSLGDDAFDCLAYDLTSLHGQIARLNVSTIPAGAGSQVARSLLDPGDNPFAANSNANAKLVYAYGLRNPFRFQIDPVTGAIYCGDVGEDTFEEENEIHAGDFLGWPYREGDSVIVHVDCPEPGGAGSLAYVHPIAKIVHDPPGDPHAIVSAGMYRPVTGAPSNWPRNYWPDRGDVFYVDYYVGDLFRLAWNGERWVRPAPVPGQPTDSTWASGLFTAVDFQVGPDGSLWWMRQFNDSFTPSSGSLQRVRFVPGVTAVEAPDSRLELRAAPNPFGSGVDLAFRLPVPGRVRLTILDLAGRTVRTLLDGEVAAGPTRVVWTGVDERGARAPAGVYFARLDRPGSLRPTLLRLLRVP